MPQIEHNAPKFKYRIYYKLDEPGKTWNIEDIADWKQKELVIPNTDTYTRYIDISTCNFELIIYFSVISFFF